ncbi:hypothetical protein [Microlunatus soli]|uniref:hypothetical protein n=1 Tax=Microlunatus soli TaxID=630515 RepID=UPI0012F74C8B|nr:hypothetical protein [Microlunatus soli]
MPTRLPAALRPDFGPGVRAARGRTSRAFAITEMIADLGPFVVRRFVDFARTKSMMCRASA